MSNTLELEKEYYWKRTKGWLWDGRPRWWEVFVEIDGFNGGGGFWLREKWRWNNSDETIREIVQSLSLEDSRKLAKEVAANIGTAPNAGKEG